MKIEHSVLWDVVKVAVDPNADEQNVGTELDYNKRRAFYWGGKTEHEPRTHTHTKKKPQMNEKLITKI